MWHGKICNLFLRRVQKFGNPSKVNANKEPVGPGHLCSLARILLCESLSSS